MSPACAKDRLLRGTFLLRVARGLTVELSPHADRCDREKRAVEMKDRARNGIERVTLNSAVSVVVPLIDIYLFRLIFNGPPYLKVCWGNSPFLVFSSTCTLYSGSFPVLPACIAASH